LSVRDCNERPTLIVDNEVRAINENVVGPVGGEAIGFVDLDDDETQTHAFEIEEGTGSDLFEISNLGVISTKSSLNYESSATYYIQVRVTDVMSEGRTNIGDGLFSQTAAFTITVNNVNEAPVVEDKVIAVTEGTKSGDSLLPFQAQVSE